MLKKLASVCLMLGILGAANALVAQTDDSQSQDKPILKRLDNFGKTLFGGILPAEESKDHEKAAPKSSDKTKIQKPSSAAKPYDVQSATGKPVTAKPTVVKPSPVDGTNDQDMSMGVGRRAGSILSGAGERVSSLLGVKPSDDELMPENTPPTTPRPSKNIAKETMPPISVDPEESELQETQEIRKPVRRPLAGSLMINETEGTIEDSEDPTSTIPAIESDTVVEAESAAPSDPVVEAEEAVEQEKASAKAPVHVQAAPSTAMKPFTKPLHERMSSFRQSAFAKDASETSTPVESPVAKPAPVKAEEKPLIAQRPKLAVEVDSAPQAASGMNDHAKVIRNSMAAPSIATTEQAAEPDENMLIARKGPVLSVETLGPRRISVGKESTYEVNMVNSGDVAAENMAVFVSLPEWAEVVGTDVSVGSPQNSVSRPAAGTLQWNLGHLNANGRERLTLRIIPRQSRAFDLAVRWEYRPVESQASIEVQEPKLVLQLEGPREVLFGKKEAYRLKLKNAGNGAAENVSIMLMPIGGGENVPATHKIGIMAAGEEKVLDVELTARQAGDLTIQLDARADGDVHAELAEKVIVRRAELKIDVEGPAMQFVGATTSYSIRVSNPGSAPARNVHVSIALPAGSKYLAGLDGAELDPTGSKLYWTIDSLGPNIEQMFMVKCTLGAAGVSRVETSATADDELTAASDTVTRVEAVADITMDVKNPKGPVAVGDETLYEVVVHNRGTKEATGVEVFAYFSRGIEPISAEGAPNRLGPGQVTFQAIPLLAPGAEVTLKVRARADEPGNHVFRAEAHSKPLGSRLISEATNLYYTESSLARQATRPTNTPNPQTEPMRTGNRYSNPGEMVPVPPRK